MYTPPWSWFLVPGVFKLSCSPLSLFSYVQFLSTGPFNYISFQKLSPRYLCFQLPSYSLFQPNQPFSCIYLQHSSSLYSFCSLRSPSDQACLPCAASMSAEDGILVAEVPRGVQHASSAWTSPRRVVSWPNPVNQLVVLCPNFDQKAAAQGQSGDGIKLCFFVTWVYCVLSPGAHLLECRLCTSPCWTWWRVGTKRNESFINITWLQSTNPSKEDW